MTLLLALESLWDARRRNALALLGLGVGVTAVVALVTLTTIVRREALRQFDREGLNVMSIRKTSAPPASSVRRPPPIDLELVRELAVAVPEIERVAPVIPARGPVRSGGRTFNASLVGVTEPFFEINTMPLAAGRRFTVLDEDQPFVVLGRDAAKNLGAGAPEELIGYTVVIQDRPLTVIGVLATASAVRLYAEDLNQAVFLPAGTPARLFHPAEIELILLRTHVGERDADLVGALHRFLQERVPGLAVEISSAEEIVAEMRRQLRLFTLLLGSAGSLAFLLGGVGMMNSLLLSVVERRAEIGLRRALGATRGEIRKQFLFEAVLLGALGGVLGLAAGVGLTAALARFAGWELQISWLVLGVALAVALSVGLAAGFLPAWQASRLKPAEAMDTRR